MNRYLIRKLKKLKCFDTNNIPKLYKRNFSNKNLFHIKNNTNKFSFSTINKKQFIPTDSLLCPKTKYFQSHYPKLQKQTDDLP